MRITLFYLAHDSLMFCNIIISNLCCVCGSGKPIKKNFNSVIKYNHMVLNDVNNEIVYLGSMFDMGNPTCRITVV